jgi:hypothetical protein
MGVFESARVGRAGDEMQLAYLYVSRAYRGRGVGRQLFDAAVSFALDAGVNALYVSATPTENTVDFYLNRGCVLAPEPDPRLLGRRAPRHPPPLSTLNAHARVAQASRARPSSRSSESSLAHARGNTEGTQARVHASTRGHSFCGESFGFRGFRGRRDPRLPLLPSSRLNGKEGVDGSSPPEGFEFFPA